jgi:hypothetical protein
LWYIGRVEDQELRVAVQRVNVGMARDIGAVVEYRKLTSSHSPLLSWSNEVGAFWWKLQQHLRAQL